MIYGENELDENAMNKMIDNYDGKYKLKTLNLPVEENAFNDEINDDLFEQYYLQESTPMDSDKIYYLEKYQKLFAFNYQKEEKFSESSPDLNYVAISLKRKATFTNEDNFAKLILNLLNALSLWFDLGVLDCHVYIFKLRYIFLFLFTLLTKLENLLLKSIHRNDKAFVNFTRKIFFRKDNRISQHS